MGPSGTSILLLLGLVACVLAAKELGPNADLLKYAHPTLVIGGGPYSPPSQFDSDVSPQNSKRAAATTLTPAQIIAAYSVTGWSATSTTYGAGKTIAIIDAYNCSTCERDLATFTTQWGLSACTTANGCFKKVTQTGATTGWPADDTTSNWGFEAVMDIQAAHAMAPAAKIVLIVCNSNSYADLFAGVLYAINTLKANVVSMSWGGKEASSLFTTYDPYFSSTSIGYFASTGDNGAAGGIIYPSSSSKVIAVGGTTLLTNSGAWTTEATEQGWSGSGGNCSAFTAALSVQSSYSGYSCGGKKQIPDLSLLADPASGMYTYYSGLNNGVAACTPPSCWFGGGGTSLAAPLLAARAAARGILANPTSVYSGLSYRDITVGSNGAFSCGVGLDKVTGVGSLLG